MNRTGHVPSMAKAPRFHLPCVSGDVCRDRAISAAATLGGHVDIGVPQVSQQHPEDISAVPRHLEQPITRVRPSRNLPRHLPCRHSWWLSHLSPKELL